MRLFERPSLIGRFSTSFITRYRITVLLFLALLGLGYVAYTQWLKIEGFPPIEVPIVIVETDYFVNDANQVDQAVTQPIEHALNQIPQIIEVTSTTLPVGATVVARFDDTLTSDEGASLVRDAIQADVTVPDGAVINYRTINAGAFDGKHDLLFELSGDFTVSALQAKAEQVAAEVEKDGFVATATALNLITKEINPVTGQTFENQNGFNRVGFRQKGVMQFAPAVSIGVIAKPDVSIVDLSSAVKERVERLTDEGHLQDYTITYGGDPSDGVLRQRAQLEQNALAGFIAVVVLIFLLIDWLQFVKLSGRWGPQLSPERGPPSWCFSRWRLFPVCSGNLLCLFRLRLFSRCWFHY